MFFNNVNNRIKIHILFCCIFRWIVFKNPLSWLSVKYILKCQQIAGFSLSKLVFRERVCMHVGQEHKNKWIHILLAKEDVK